IELIASLELPELYSAYQGLASVSECLLFFCRFSNITLSVCIGIGFVKNISTPLLKASCLVSGFAAPVRAISATGGRPCSRSNCRMRFVLSTPDITGIEISVAMRQRLARYFFLLE